MLTMRSVIRAGAAVLFLAGALPVASCGGSGGDDQGPPPLVFVVFPPGASFTEAQQITVRGVSTGTPITAVTVGNVPAASASGFQTWSAVVPLVEGENEFRVVATDAAGMQDPSAPTLRVTRGLRLSPPAAIDFDVAGNRLLLLDAGVRRLTLFDLTTGAHTLLSGSGRGTGTAFGRPERAIFDLPGNRALVTDSDLDAVFAVDLATGNRTFLTGQGVGSGTALNTPQGMVLHSVLNRVLLVDNTLDAVVAVNLATGARTILSSAAVGTGTAFSLPTEIEHDVAGNRVFVRDPSVGALFAVALATGDRTIVIDDMGGSFFDQFGGMALDLPNNRMLATDGGFDGVFATDLTTGVHTMISSESVGSGSVLDGPGTLVFDPANGRVIVGQGDFVRLLAIDLADGERTALLDQVLGTGPRFDRPEAVAFDFARGRLLVADDTIRIGTGIGAVLAVDYATGDRAAFFADPPPEGGFSRPSAIRVHLPSGRAFVYSSTGGRLDALELDDADRTTISQQGGSGVGSGEDLQFASDMCYDAAAGRFLLPVGSTVNGLIAVDETTGDRTIFANAAVGTGVSTSGGLAVECDPAGALVWYGTNNSGTIARIDVPTGVRTVLTIDPGVGPSVSGMTAIRLDAAQNRLIVCAGGNDSVIAVDLTTGIRTELSGPNVGQGVPVTGMLDGDVNLDLQLAAFADITMEWIVVVDLTNGDRVAFSR
jgi:hypothetical protein